MLNLTLPLIIQNNNLLNTNFYNYLKQIKDWYQVQDLNIASLYGSFPFFTLNGDINLNQRQQKFYLKNDIIDLNKNLFFPIRLDCSNIEISYLDLSDRYTNFILNLFNQQNNLLEVSNLQVLETIANKYSNYKYILSKNINLFNDFNINDIIKKYQDLFLLIELPQSLYHNDILNNIENKDKFEIIISNKCQCQDTNQLLQCMKDEHRYINNFCESSVFINCDQLNQYNKSNEILTELKYYSNLGFTNFKIDSPPLFLQTKFYQYLVCNLIQDKYILQTLQEVLKINAKID